MIGKIYISEIPYFDKETGKHGKKQRPILIILEPPVEQELTVLPVSTIPNKKYFDEKYDVLLEKTNYPKLKLSRDSYIRTHKQTTVYKPTCNCCLGNLKSDYPETYNDALQRLKMFDELKYEKA